jgi:hypothetical protein
MWDLRHNLSAHDATYVALAEVLGCSLVTGDKRLAGAPGPTCSIVVVRRCRWSVLAARRQQRPADDQRYTKECPR